MEENDFFKWKTIYDAYLYHDLRRNERIISRHQIGGGSVMIFCAIDYKEQNKIVFFKW